MQKTIYAILLSLLISLGFTACDNDLDVAAKWKEIAVVYALLEPSSSTNYIRIQRAYLDEKTSAVAFSNISDSLYFDTLVVKLTEYHNGIEGNTYSLSKVDGNQIGLPKEDGIFNTEHNYLYRLTAPVKESSYFNTYTYKLTIYNPETGNVVTATTVSLGNARIKAPVSGNGSKMTVKGDSVSRIYAIYDEGIYSRSYDMTIRVKVEEISLEDTTVRDTLHIDWDLFKDKKTQSLSGFNESSHNTLSRIFYFLLANNLDSNKNVKRRLLGFDLMLTGIGDDIYTYINVNEPSIGIVQKKPEFTNVVNGIGVFSSRLTNRILDREFDESTHMTITIHELTKPFNFVGY